MASLKHIVRKPITLRTALLSLCAGAILSVPSASFAGTLYVDDDNPNVYPTIQAAIADASAGDTIRVYPGNYSGDNGGPIVVNKSVIIQGAGPGVNDFPVANPATTPATRTGPAPGSADASTQSIVYNNGYGGFDVQANNVTISRFWIIGSNAAPTYPNAGIILRTGSGRIINYVAFQNNGLGIYIDGTETNLDVNINAFYYNYRNGNIPSGGIFSPAAAVSTALIRNNVFRYNGQFSINIGAGAVAPDPAALATTGLQINNNSASSDGAFVVLGNTVGARITNNIAAGLASSGVYSSGNNNGLVISGNKFSGRGTTVDTTGRIPGSATQDTTNIGAGVRMNIASNNTVGDVNPSITGNIISAFPYDGIGLRDVSGAVIRDNDLNGNGRHGLWLQNATGAQIRQNRIGSNLTTGIRVEAVSVNNTIGLNATQGNTLSGNTLDASDASTGNKTAGTANTWKGNTGATATPPGIINN